MSSSEAAAETSPRFNRESLPSLGTMLPGLALAVMFLVCVILEPESLTLNGLALLFSPAIPLVLASMSQMFIIALGDIDLGNGQLVGLVTAVCAVHMTGNPLLMVAMLAGVVVLYVVQAVLIQTRGIPAIIVTLGFSFVWLGIGLAVLPTPGGSAPQWLVSVMNMSGFETANYVIPIPVPLLMAVVIGILGYLIIQATPTGARIRAVGSNPDSVRRAGGSLLRVRCAAYAIAAGFAILAGIALVGQTSSGDVTTTVNYTLLTIAAVILGGGQFSGGRGVPFGAVIGALAMSLVASMLSFLNLASSYQTAAQGLILILVLAGRILTERART